MLFHNITKYNRCVSKKIIKRNISRVKDTKSIQIVSNVHLSKFNSTISKYDTIELNKWFAAMIKPSSPILLLAGGIGNPFDKVYCNFIKYCSDNFSKTFVVASYDEFCNDVWHKTDEQIENVTSLSPNVKYLHHATHSLTHEYDIIGTTFDTRRVAQIIREGLDFTLGEIHPDLPHRLNYVLRSNLEKLKEQVNNHQKSSKPKKLLIMSDYLPNPELSRIALMEDNNFAELNKSFLELGTLIKDNPNIKVWVTGYKSSENFAPGLCKLMYDDNVYGSGTSRPIILNLD